MNNVFPEPLGELPEDPYEAVKIMEDYIRYMTERMDFALSGGLKLGGRNLAQISDEVTAIEGNIVTINGDITDIEGDITTINTSLGNKVDKVSGKGLSTNDYTTTEKNKLAGIAEGANKTTVDTALSTSSTNPVRNSVVTTAINGKEPSIAFSNTSYSVATYGGTVYVRKWGRVVEVFGNNIGTTSNIAANTNVTIATIGSDYRPASVDLAVDGQTRSPANAALLKVVVRTTGAVDVNGLEKVTSGRFNCTFVK